jgi:hypothetical protein
LGLWVKDQFSYRNHLLGNIAVLCNEQVIYNEPVYISRLGWGTERLGNRGSLIGRGTDVLIHNVHTGCVADWVLFQE